MSTEVGYSGGTAPDPTYRRLGDHTETIRVTYDPSVITYAALLDLFFKSHDATWRSPDRQYISFILTSGDEQAREARAALEAANKTHGGRVATVVKALDRFTPAEDYHQKYYLRGATDYYEALRLAYPDEKSFTLSTAAARVNGYLGDNLSPQRLVAELPLFGLPPSVSARLKELVEGN